MLWENVLNVDVRDHVALQLLENMLSTKALLDHAEAEMKTGCAEEEKLQEHLKAINPSNTSVEPDSGSFSPGTLRTSKQRSEALVQRGQTSINQIKEHVEMWRTAIQEELEASATGLDMLGDRGSFGFQALACLLPMKQRCADALARWTKIDIRFGAIAMPDEGDDGVCTVS